MDKVAALKTALLTGASSGIGRATALRMAEAGYRLMLTARNKEALQAVASTIHGSGGEAVTFACDITDPAAVRLLFCETIERLGQLDVLINNAGAGEIVHAADTSDETWFRTLNTNLSSVFFCCREAIPLLKLRDDGGLIINNVSVAAVRGFPGFTAYSAGKAGVLGFSRALREELRDTGIRVSVIMPGATDSAFWDQLPGKWSRDRMMHADDVARTIVHIAQLPSNVMMEELTMMPAGGAL